MVLERSILPFWEWFFGSAGSLGALWTFLIVVAVLALLALLVSFLVALVRSGPMAAGDAIYRVTATGVRELLHVSPRRVWALSRLAIQESMRRRVWVALLVYALVLLFATWFIQTDYREPAELFFTFVLSATTFLILGVALLLSAFSLPNDIKSKTIYTVATKPVRAGEIVLGRMLGFTLVGTAMLVVMGACSYLFVISSLDHSHEIEVASLQPLEAADGSPAGRQGRTTRDEFHRHQVRQNEEGRWSLQSNYSHHHPVREQGERLVVEDPDGFLQARVAQYGQLRFLDRAGAPASRGVSVGNEWTYRSFIDGRTPAAAIWTFDRARQALTREGLNLEIRVRVFRTHKGDIDRGIRGEIFLRNPETGLRTSSRIFTAKDDQLDDQSFAPKLQGPSQERLDLADDLISQDGRLEVWIRCLEGGQYFGFAQPDCYIRHPDAWPFVNFVKAQLSIWVQMVIVIAIGVACSTLVNGPVAMLFTVAFVLLGFQREEFVKIATNENYGGGPVESLVRMLTQKNVVTPLEPGAGTTLVVTLDEGIRWVMRAVSQVLPDFPRFNTINFVAEGFNIPATEVLQHLVIGVAFMLSLFVVGYFFLRTRELAK